MKLFGRRYFLSILSVSPLLGLAVSCKKEPKPADVAPGQQLTRDPNAMALTRSMTKDQVYAMLDQRVQVVMEKSHNCAQSTFYVLSEQFGLGGDDILKALTPLPGMAERGRPAEH
jgi:hypothetical protein